MKKFSKVLILSAVLALPISISASNDNLSTDGKVTMSSVKLSDDACHMRARGRTNGGVRYRLKGSCSKVLETLRSLGEI